MQIGHNLAVSEKPFFRRDGCVVNLAHYFRRDTGKRIFRMRRRRIGLALASAMVSGSALAMVWAHAREATAVLAAQDDPAELSDVQLRSALRNNQNIIADQIRAALAAHDVGLAESFVDLSDAKALPLADDL